MSLSLQPAVSTSPVNGLPAQSVDGAAPQPLSFGEVLKVEEKKLQQEQEISAQSVAALLATMQPPAVTEFITEFIAGVESMPAQTNDQTALKTDSVQPANATPRQDAPTTGAQIPTEKTGAGISVHKLESNSTSTPASFKVNITPPQPETAPQLTFKTEKLIVANQHETTPAVIDGEAKVFTSETWSVEPAQANTVAAEILQPANKMNISTAKAASSNISGQGKVVPVFLEGEIQSPRNAPAFEIQQPVEKTMSQLKNVILSDGAAFPEGEGSLLQNNETLQPQGTLPQSDKLIFETVSNTPVVRAVSSEAATQSEPVPTKSTVAENLQTPGKANTIAAKVTMEQGKSEPIVADTKLESNQKTFTAKTKQIESVQVGTTADEVLRSVSKTTSPVSKATAGQRESEPVIVDTKFETIELPQSKVAATSHPENVVPSDGEESLSRNYETTLPQRMLEQRDAIVFETNTSNFDAPLSQPAEKTNTQTTAVYEPVAVDETTRITREPSAVGVNTSTPDQTNMPVFETSQPAEKANLPLAAALPSNTTNMTPDVEEQVDVEQKSFAAEIRSSAPAEANIAAEKATMPARAEVKAAVSNQANVPINTTSRWVQETVVPSVKAVVSNDQVTIEKKAAVISVDVVNQNKFEASFSQSVVETLQPTATAGVSNTKVISSTVPIATPVKEKQLETQQKPFAVEMESAVPTDMGVSTEKKTIQVKSDQPVAEALKTAIPVQAESQLLNEVSQSSKAAAALKPAASAQVGLSVSENSQVAKETVSPTVKVDVQVDSVDTKISDVKAETKVTEISRPVTSPVPLVETEESILNNKDGKAVTSLHVGAATAESHLESGSRPQVRNEAFAIGPENAPAQIQPKKAAQPVRVEIKSAEKVEAKEPGLELESSAAIAGTDKGTAAVDVVKKSSVARVEPMLSDVIEQITSQLKVRIKSGETSIRMNLNPETLGAIEVQMTHSAQGISVSFITEQSSTGQLLESQVSQLRQSLKDAGVQLTNLNISQHQHSNQEGGGFKQSQQFVQTSQRGVPQVDEAIQPQRVGLTSEIDYLV